jgi:hypothetical protein
MNSKPRIEAMQEEITQAEQPTAEESKPARPQKEKRMVTIRRYEGPYVRQYPKNVKKSFREISRAVQSSEEYAAAFFGELSAPMIAAGISQDKAAEAASLIMIRMFQRDMRGSRIYKKAMEAAPRA